MLAAPFVLKSNKVENINAFLGTKNRALEMAEHVENAVDNGQWSLATSWVAAITGVLPQELFWAACDAGLENAVEHVAPMAGCSMDYNSVMQQGLLIAIKNQNLSLVKLLLQNDFRMLNTLMDNEASGSHILNALGGADDQHIVFAVYNAFAKRHPDKKEDAVMKAFSKASHSVAIQALGGFVGYFMDKKLKAANLALENNQ